MSWLDSTIEGLYCDDSIDEFSMPTHELHEFNGKLQAFRMVEDKAKELGFITPKILGKGLNEV